MDKSGLEKMLCIVVRWTFASFSPPVIFFNNVFTTSPWCSGTPSAPLLNSRAEPVLTSTGARLSPYFPVFAFGTWGFAFKPRARF